MHEENIKIFLTKDEALVLFELLSQFSDSDKLVIEHQSEKRALWNLNCLLEQLFKDNYLELLYAARERLDFIQLTLFK